MLQAYGSKVCGAYCCYAILKLKNCNENTLKNIFSRFDRNNRKNNDFLIGEFVSNNWPLKYCTDVFTKSKKQSIPTIKQPPSHLYLQVIFWDHRNKSYQPN